MSGAEAEVDLVPGGIQPAPPAASPDQRARERIAALTVELMMKDGIPPHVIVGALLANLTLVICSAASSVGEAMRSLGVAAEALKANKRLVSTLHGKAAATRHVASRLPGTPQ